MPRLIETPTIIEAAGSPPKRIEEFVGRVNSSDDRVSVARMVSPQGWEEPGQTPEFAEITLVITAMTASQVMSALITAPKTPNLAVKPPVGGMPVSDSMK